ncbi:PLDc N-terminal domain-containing protein [Pseudochryseolinea flava]|uniref:Cardiolipin synthase N-terminal domain-containing protein n=1 Tax=Pseudochryseolinea flava TaxID=2059302 RepID=A0A364XVB8_9BACT|nr:PLDc N-terminal domain-containing protein [Pseudochryseolinea flava]RAV98269.1 hypothetical protein DQQ10_24270 [Pseudochryseolinea flava]
MGRIIGLLVLVVMIVTIVDIVNSNRDSEKKILWVLAVVFFPILGALAWLLVSRNIIKL